MPKTFLSYASEDAIFADLARLKLQDAGIDVWIDAGNLRAGEEWRNAIDEGISTADVLLVVLTPESGKSPYVTYEWAYALGSGIRVIPMLLQDADIHPRLSVLQYLDFRDQRKGPWDQLCHEIHQSGNSTTESDNDTYVKDMTVEQLQQLISGAVSLAAAGSEQSSTETTEASISRATKSIVGAFSVYPESSRSNQPQILWVDDRPNNNIHERAAFESMGFEFTLALSTDEALSILSDRDFDAIISDMGRKEGPREGYKLLDALRTSNNVTPFFIYAGSNAPEHKAEAAHRGAQGSTNNARELFDLVTALLVPRADVG